MIARRGGRGGGGWNRAGTSPTCGSTDRPTNLQVSSRFSRSSSALNGCSSTLGGRAASVSLSSISIHLLHLLTWSLNLTPQNFLNWKFEQAQQEVSAMSLVVNLNSLTSADRSPTLWFSASRVWLTGIETVSLGRTKHNMDQVTVQDHSCAPVQGRCAAPCGW